MIGSYHLIDSAAYYLPLILYCELSGDKNKQAHIYFALNLVL